MNTQNDDYSSEKYIIENILDLKNLRAMDIMIPRADIIGIEKSESYKNIVEIIDKHHHMRYPVYNENLDNILGIVKINDLAISLISSKKPNITSIMTPCLFISPAMPVLDLLLKMRSDNINTALVVDEFGGVDGLISIYDITEEIVGEIKGFSDRAIDTPIIRHKNGSVTIDARLELEDFEKEMNVSLTDDESINTVGGVIFDEIGRVPVKGELITLKNDVVCEIIEANPRCIKTIKIRNLDS